MIYMIKYDRAKGALEYIEEFADSEVEAANSARLQAEMTAGLENINLEIVTLQAESESDLRITHSRYFKNLKQLRGSLRPR